MMKEKTIDIVVAFVIIVLVVAGLSYVLIKVSGITNPAETKVTLGEGVINPVEKNGRWVVPDDQVPDDADALLVGPALALIPDRRETFIDDSGKVPSGDRAVISNMISGFLGEWETFDPSEIVQAEYDGKKNPYEDRLRRYVVPSSLDEIALRSDASDPEGVCVECNAGLVWMGAGDVKASVALNEYDGNRVYASVSGIVRYQADPKQLNPRNGELISRSYGLILKKEGDKWLIERAATGEGQTVGG